jgi:hypothetical protein
MANVTPTQPELITLDSDIEDSFDDVGMTCKNATGKLNVDRVGSDDPSDGVVGVGSAWKIQLRWSCASCVKFGPEKPR